MARRNPTTFQESAMPTCHRHTTVLLFLTIENDRSSILVLAAKFKEEVRNNTAANVRVSEGLGKKPSFRLPHVL